MSITLTPHPDGYQIELSDGTVVLGPDGRGMTLEEARSAADFIEQRNDRGSIESRIDTMRTPEVMPR